MDSMNRHNKLWKNQYFDKDKRTPDSRHSCMHNKQTQANRQFIFFKQQFNIPSTIEHLIVVRATPGNVSSWLPFVSQICGVSHIKIQVQNSTLDFDMDALGTGGLD